MLHDPEPFASYSGESSAWRRRSERLLRVEMALVVLVSIGGLVLAFTRATEATWLVAAATGALTILAFYRRQRSQGAYDVERRLLGVEAARSLQWRYAVGASEFAAPDARERLLRGLTELARDLGATVGVHPGDELDSIRAKALNERAEIYVEARLGTWVLWLRSRGARLTRSAFRANLVFALFSLMTLVLAALTTVGAPVEAAGIAAAIAGAARAYSDQGQFDVTAIDYTRTYMELERIQRSARDIRGVDELDKLIDHVEAVISIMLESRAARTV